MDKTPISAEFLENKGFYQLKNQQYKHLVYSKIYHSSVYGDIMIRIDVADKESSMEASRLSTVDERGCRGYSSFWLPNPTYVYQFQLALDLLEIKD